MKKFFTVAMCAMLVGNTLMHAQQIKGDFDKQAEWGVQTSFMGPDPSFTDMGITPDGWGALNVTQMGMNFPLVFGEEGKSGKCVKMMNRKLGAFGIGANSPSYVTLGKPWVYADIMGVISQLGDKADPDDSNGGSLGGIDFSFRPDSIVGFYKREHGEQNPNEIAQVIVYSWIGTCKSYSPIGDGMEATETLPKEALVDREIDILGVYNNHKPANGITLIGKKIYNIEGDLKEWTRLSLPIEYFRSENPMKLNVILSSADYFNRPNIGEENKLWADEVRFIYNSKLQSISIDGKEIDAFDEDTMVYVFPETDASKPVMAKAFGKDAHVTIGELKDSKRIITVTDQSAAGVKTHVYTLIYKGSPAQLTWNAIDPNLCIYGDTIDIKPVSANTEGVFSYEISHSNIAKVIDGNKLCFVGSGSFTIVARQSAAGNYSPSVSEPLSISVKKAPLSIGVKDIERVYNYRDDNFEFVYEGLKNKDEADKVLSVKPTASIPEQTLPNGDKLTTSKGVYVGEYPITVSGAESANYEITYQSGTLKVTPAAPIVIGIKAASMTAGEELPPLVVDYSKLIGEDKSNPDLVFSVKPALTTTAKKESPVGKYDITFATNGTLTESALRNYQGITFAEKGTLTIKAVKVQLKFEEVVSKIEGLPQEEYVYASHTDSLGTIVLYGADNKVINPKQLTFKASNNNAFGIDKNGSYRLWGGVNGATGEVDITVTVNETDTTLAVSKVIFTTKITKKPAIVKPMDFTLTSTDFTGNTDYIPIYVKSDAFIPRDFDTFQLLGAFVNCPTLKIDTPDGILVLAEDPEAEYSNTFLEEAVVKLHALPAGKYTFTVEGGNSTQYECTFDNTVKGTLFIPAKSIVEIKGIDSLAYGRKESFKPEIKANGSIISAYTLTTHHITNSHQPGEFVVLTPGTDTLTFVIPATDMTVEETYTRIITVNKGLLTITPENITANQGEVVIPQEYELIYEGFAEGDDVHSLDVLPTVFCQVVEDAKAGDQFAIFATAAEDDKYEMVYKEGVFSVIDGSSIDPMQEAEEISIHAVGKKLCIEGNDKAEPVSVYTVQGVLVGQYSGAEATIQTDLRGGTIYIVRVGAYATRVWIK